MQPNANDQAILGYTVGESSDHELLVALAKIKSWLSVDSSAPAARELPHGFVRQMLVAREKLHETIELAVIEYCQAEEDIDALTRVAALLGPAPELPRFMIDDLHTRLKRRRAEVGRILKAWGVRISVPKTGDEFDPEFHKIVKSNHDENEELDIASVESPLFQWKDEHGQPQLIRAAVTVQPYFPRVRKGIA